MVLRRSIRMLLPRSVAGPFAHGAGCLSLSESPGSQLSLQPWSVRSQLSRWTGLFISAQNRCEHRFCRAFNASTRRGHSGPFFPLRKPRNSGRMSPSPVPLPAVGVVVSEPFQGVFGGTKNSPAPNDPKLGRLRRTRQALVRVPESNTKYGGKPGKPEAVRHPLMPQVSVSPSGIPSEKNLPEAPIRGCARCSQGKYFLSVKGCAGKTHVKLRGVRAGMPEGRSAWDNRQGAGDSTGSSP
jgi:hypothetical protein